MKLRPRAIPFLGIHKSEFLFSAPVSLPILPNHERARSLPILAVVIDEGLNDSGDT